MPIVTIRPDGTWYGGAAVVLVGAADLDNALSDNSVGSYASVEYGTYGGLCGDVYLQEASSFVPANAIITRVRGRALVINVSALEDFDGSFIRGFFGDWAKTFLGYAFSTQGQGIDVGSAVEMAGPWLPTRSDGAAWTRDNLDLTRLKIELVTPNSSDPGQHAHVYEAYVDIEYNRPPTLGVVAPVGGSFIEVDSPKYHWAFVDPDGDAQKYGRVRVFSAAQVAAGGFNPQYSVSVADSAWLSGGVQEWQGPSLPNGNYRAYMIATQEAGGLDTGWGNYTDFSVVALPIAPPTIRAVPTPWTTDGAIWLDVRGGLNLLSMDDSAFELTTGSWGWTGGTGVRTTTAGEFLTGVAGFRLTSTGAGTPFMFSTSLTNIVEKQLYRIKYRIKSNVVRTALPSISWINAGGVVIGTFLDFIGTPVGPVGNGFIDVQSPVIVAPPGAVTAKIGLTWSAVGAGEIFYVDDVALVPAGVQNSIWGDDHSFFEGGIGYWKAKLNGYDPVRTVVAGQFFSGVAGLKLQAVAAGDMKYWPYQTYGGGVDTFPTATHISGRLWRVRVLVKAAATGRSISLGFEATNAAGALIYTEEGPVIGADVTSGWYLIEREIEVPVGTARFFPYVTIAGCAAGEIHYLDEFLVWQKPANPTPWGRGGLWPYGTINDPDVTYEVEVTHDAGLTWTPLPYVDPFEWNPSRLLMAQDQDARVRDWAAPPNVEIYYRARANVDVGTGILQSPWDFSPGVMLTGTSAYLKDPYTETALAVILESFSRSYVEPSTIHYPLSRGAAVAVSEGSKGSMLSIQLRTLDQASRVALEALLTSGRPLLFQNTLGETWWIKVMDGGSGEIVRAQPNLGDLYGIRDFYRWDIRAVEVVAPDLST